MDLFWPLILSSIAGFSTLLGYFFIYLPVKKVNEFIPFALSFSLSVMIMISVFDLIPSSIPFIGNNLIKSILIFVIFFTLGIILVHILNKLIEREKGKSNLYRLGILSFIALVLHNFPEGILTFMSTYKDFSLGLSLCLSITLHNIPEGISIAVPMYYSTSNKWEAFKITLLSALAEPLGAIVAFCVLKNHITNEMISVVLILVAGIMISLSINKMLPEARGYQKKKPLYYGFILGIIIVLLSLFIL